MKIAIHKAKGSFSERWVPYCEAKGIDYKIVDCYRSDIISQLSDCDALMWHFNHKGAKESKFAKQLLHAVEKSGKVIFPDYNTVWHFDDKVAQKYLLEAIEAPMAPAYVFYDTQSALKWASEKTFPVVFKLRNGAGSDNVKLVKSLKRAKSLIKKSFNRGFKQYDAWGNLKERVRKLKEGKTTLWDVTKGFARLFYTTEYARVTGNEVGYAYFQEFVPENQHDIRVCVVGDKAFAIKRMVRKNDFRASGSGAVLYDKENFRDDVVEMAFEVAKKIGGQSVALDFVFMNGKPLILEVSYGFVKEVYDDCVGYWDENMRWYEGHFNPYGWMVEGIVSTIKRNCVMSSEPTGSELS